jgi:hypothetical protein
LGRIVNANRILMGNVKAKADFKSPRRGWVDNIEVDIQGREDVG